MTTTDVLRAVPMFQGMTDRPFAAVSQTAEETDSPEGGVIVPEEIARLRESGVIGFTGLGRAKRTSPPGAGEGPVPGPQRSGPKGTIPASAKNDPSAPVTAKNGCATCVGRSASLLAAAAEAPI
mgnify:CR=1 FL=1